MNRLEDPGENSELDALSSLYRAYESWIAQYTFACHKSCASCCTQSVTITTLEGETIVAFLRKQQRLEKFALLLEKRSTTMRPLQTTNQFAAQCLAEIESPEEEEPVWDFTPCVFLENDLCSIYPARPFSCRGFASLKQCDTNGCAEVAPLFITLNTVAQQMIEHLNSDGGSWGNMVDILRLLLPGMGKEGQLQDYVLAAQRNPGFLIPPKEAPAIEAFFARLKRLQENSADSV